MATSFNDMQARQATQPATEESVRLTENLMIDRLARDEDIKLYVRLRDEGTAFTQAEISAWNDALQSFKKRSSGSERMRVRELLGVEPESFEEIFAAHLGQQEITA